MKAEFTSPQPKGHSNFSRRRLSYRKFKPAVIFPVMLLIGIAGTRPAAAQTALLVRKLSCEQMAEPMGIETAQPRFSWKLDSAENGQFQTAYQILVASSTAKLSANTGNLWDSGWVNGSESQLIPYAGVPLTSLQNGWWKIRVKDRSGIATDWSAPARFATGLLPGTAAPGQWIYDASADPKTGTSWFRKSLSLGVAPGQALLLLASRGYHELYINGIKVGDRALAPDASIIGPWVAAKRVLYVVYDVAPYLKAGQNTLAVWISPGRIGDNNITDPVTPALLVYGNIAGQTLVSDASWKTKTSNLTRYYAAVPKPMYGGEQWNDSAFIPDWNKTGYADSAWAFAAVRTQKSPLSADIIPPTRRVEPIPAKTIVRRPDGSVLVDFGGFYTGQLEARVQGTSGQPIRFAALSDTNKPEYFGQYSQVIPGAGGAAVFQHRFHWMCGRWVEITGTTGTPALSDIKLHRISTDFDRIGFFQCSDDLLNAMYETDLYTYRNLTLDGYNHDCTHRERRGYGEHAFATSRGMAGTYDLNAFVKKWLRDWRDVQRSDGYIYHTAPDNNGGGGTLWSSFTVLGPWDFYVQSGDRKILEENEDSARRWLNYLHTAVTNGILSRYEFGQWNFLGDWARPVPPERRALDSIVSNWGDSQQALFFNNGIYALNLQTMNQISSALNKPADVNTWSTRLNALRPAVHAGFFVPATGVYVESNQVFSMLAQLTGMVPAAEQTKVNTALDAEIRSTPYIDAGSAGLPLFLDFMVKRSGYHQRFFNMLQRLEYPGYAYFLDRNYNTWPELWDPDRATSKVHSCYIGLSSFFTRALAGVQPLSESPGYKVFSVRPSFIAGLNWVSYEFDSPRGWIKVHWERVGNEIVLDLTVPPGASAKVYLPAGMQTAGSGTNQYRFTP